MAISFDNLRVAARTLRKQPVFATVVILSLALAIALNTTMYGVLDALSHPRLDMRDPANLYWIRFYGDYRLKVDVKARDAALASGMRSYSAITRTAGTRLDALLEHGQNFVEGTVAAVAPNYFDVVGPRVIAGRTFLPSDALGGPIVLSDAAASELFPHGEPAVGAVVTIEHIPHTVIGVVSHQSNFPHEQTMAWTLPALNARESYIRLMRLRPGATRAEAERELETVADRIAVAAGQNRRDVAFRVHAAADPEFQVTGLHLALIFAVAAVLLVACANLANLQLARGISRRRDLALRAALGATRKGLVAHLLLESGLLAVGGLLAGLLLTYLGGRLLAASIPPSIGSFVVEPHMTWRVLAFAVVAMLVCLLLMGLAPSLYVSRTDLDVLLKSGAGTGATKHNRRRYGVLVGAEIALALALSSAAVLTARSAIRLSQTWNGYDPSALASGHMSSVDTTRRVVRYSDVLQTAAARVRAVDGVSDAAASTWMGWRTDAATVEDPGGVREVFPAPDVTAVSPSYLRTYRRPIVRGRDFLDGERDVGVAIVDEVTARALWPNANPIGAQIKFGMPKSAAPFVHVIGVVGEQKGFGSDSVPGARMFGQRRKGNVYYLPGASDTLTVGRFGIGVSFVARANAKPELLPVAIRRASQDWGDVIVRNVSSMDHALGLTDARQGSRFISSLFTLFAALGVGLAAFGVYGVVAHSVAERRRELGVRIALGATARDILHAVLRESVVVALSGAALGLLITKYAVKHLDSLVIEDDMFNAPVFASVALALVLTAAIAALIPAMRATRVDPTESLRND